MPEEPQSEEQQESVSGFDVINNISNTFGSISITGASDSKALYERIMEQFDKDIAAQKGKQKMSQQPQRFTPEEIQEITRQVVQRVLQALDINMLREFVPQQIAFYKLEPNRLDDIYRNLCDLIVQRLNTL